MTSRLNPSHMHPAWADESAAAIEKGGGITGYVVDGVMLSDDDPDLDPTGVNSFDATFSGNVLTVQGGEAFIHGTWGAIDIPTDVSMTGDGTTVGVGWHDAEVSVGRNTIGEDQVVVDRVGSFDGDHQYIPLWRVDHEANGGTITAIHDLRLLQRPIYNDFEGNIYMPYGDLDMNGNNVINSGNLLEGDETMFVNRSGDDMFGPLEIVGDTPGATTTPLTLRNDNTDAGTTTEIQMINSTSGVVYRGAVLRSRRSTDGGSELFFGVGDGTAIHESAHVNDDGLYSDALQTGNISFEDDNTVKYNGTNYMSFDANGITTTQNLYAHRLVPSNEVFIDSNREFYRIAVQQTNALRLSTSHVISHKILQANDKMLLNDNVHGYPQLVFNNSTTENDVHMTGVLDNAAKDHGTITFSNSDDPATSVIDLNAITGDAWFSGSVDIDTDLTVDGRWLRMGNLGGHGGLSIDENTYYSSFEGKATIYNAVDSGGSGWRFRDINGAGTVFDVTSDGVATFSNKVKVNNELVLPTRSSRPSSPDVGTIIYRTDKD